MSVIDNALKGVDGYLFLMERDTERGWYYIEVGIPNNWVFQENSAIIKCDKISENDSGKLIRITPKDESVLIDDLILFMEAIIETNKKIAEKEENFSKEMKAFKDELEKKATNFYKELENLKENSFKDLSVKFNSPPKTTTRKRSKKEVEPKVDVEN